MDQSPIMQHFDPGHLADGPLRDTFERFSRLAGGLDEDLPAGPEKSTALRKLLEAKDCAMRATVEQLREQDS